MRRLVRRHGLTPDDADDAAQELALHAHVAASRYDPARGALASYYACVLDRKAKDLMRAHAVRRRDRRGERPLDADVPAPERPSGGRDARDVRLDLNDALAGLPDGVRRTAAALADHGVAGVARLTGSSRERVRGVRRRIGRHLRRCGLP